MGHRAAAWFAWTLWMLCVALVALTALPGYLIPETPMWEMSTALAVLYGLLSLT